MSTEQSQTGHSSEENLLTIEEVSRRLKISRATIYRLLDNESLRSVRIGRSRRVYSRDLASFMDALSSKAV